MASLNLDSTVRYENCQQGRLHDEFILIHGKGAKERVVPISPYLSKALMQYLRVKEHYIEFSVYIGYNKNGKGEAECLRLTSFATH